MDIYISVKEQSGLDQELVKDLEIPHFSYSSSCRTENAEAAVLISISY